MAPSEPGGLVFDHALAHAFVGAAQAALYEAPMLRDGIVLRTQRDPDGQLVALVVPAAGFDLTELHRFLIARLPPAARPESVVIVSDLPRSPAGPVDRAQAARLAELGSGPAPAPTTAAWRGSVLQENRVLRAAHGWKDGPPTLDSVMVRLLRLRGDIRPDLWERVVRELVRRHDPLRTRFRIDEGTVFCESLAPDNALDFRVVRPSNNSTHPEGIVDYLSTRMSRRFRNGDVLLRAELLLENREEATLVLFADHLAMDEWSFDLIEAECAEIYAAVATGRSLLAVRPSSYRQWASWQRDMLDSAAGSRKLSRWRELLGPSGPFPCLPGVNDVDDAGLQQVQWLTAEGPPGWYGWLTRLAGSYRMSPFMLALWAAQAALAIGLETDTVVVHSSTSNRQRPAARDVVGYLAHGVAYPAVVDGTARLSDSVASGRALTLQCYEVQDVPLTSIVKALDPRAHGSVRSRRPPRCYFSYEPPSRSAGHALPGTRLERLPLPLFPPGRAQPGIGLELSFRSDRPRLDLTFGTGAVDLERADVIAHLFWDLVAALPDRGHHRLSAVAGQRGREGSACP